MIGANLGDCQSAELFDWYSKSELHKARMKLREFVPPERDNGFAKKIEGPMRQLPPEPGKSAASNRK